MAIILWKDIYQNTCSTITSKLISCAGFSYIIITMDLILIFITVLLLITSVPFRNTLAAITSKTKTNIEAVICH